MSKVRAVDTLFLRMVSPRTLRCPRQISRVAGDKSYRTCVVDGRGLTKLTGVGLSSRWTDRLTGQNLESRDCGDVGRPGSDADVFNLLV